MRRPIAPRVGALAVVAAVAVALALGATGCAGTAPGDQAEPVGPMSTVRVRPEVVASTPLVGALVRAIVGDQAEVRVLLGSGSDPGTVADPGTALVGADLVVLVDPSYETGLTAVTAAAGTAGVEVLALAPNLNPVPLGGSELDPDAPAAAATDPHVWLDPDRWTQAARTVGDAVSALPGVDVEVIRANVAAFDAAASRADEVIQATFAGLPEGRRALVTDLPALAYLADRYGFDLVLADGPEALAAAATTHGTGTVFVGADQQAPTAAALATIAPGLTVVGLDLDGRTTAGDGPDGYVALIVDAAQAIATGLAA